MATTTQAAPLAEQRIVLRGVSWETYEQLLANFADRGSPQLAYDRGVLEIMSPGPEHEGTNFLLSTIVVAVAEEHGIDFWAAGHTTFRRPDAKQGFEADSSFYLGDGPVARGAVAIDQLGGPPPDLVIEVDVTHGSLDKLPIYATFGVPEIWSHVHDRVVILVLGGSGYREVATSAVLPLLTAEALTSLVVASRTGSRLEWLRTLRAWVRELR